MNKMILSLFVYLVLMACHNSKNQLNNVLRAKDQQGADAKDDTLIRTPCAIFYSPDSAQQQKLKSEDGEEAYYIIAENYQNHLADARIFLENKGVKIIEFNKKDMHFLSANGNKTTLHFNTLKYHWAIWLFNGNTLYKADITNIDNEYNKYIK